MKRIRYSQSWYEVGALGFSEEKFSAGQHYPVTDETRRHADRGIAEEIDVPDEPAPDSHAEGGADADPAAAAPTAARKRGAK